MQRTSTIFLGHRQNATNERQFPNETVTFMTKEKASRTLRFAHIFDPERTLDEALSGGTQYVNRPKNSNRQLLPVATAFLRDERLRRTRTRLGR